MKTYAFRPQVGVGALAALLLAFNPLSWAGGIVTTCTEAALRTAMAGGGEVTFACDGAITLGGTITVAADTAISGSGHSIVLSGGNLVRVLDVLTNATLTVIDLTISDGLSTHGGGIANAGTVNATNCVFSRNRAYGTPASSPGAGGDGFGGALYNTGTFNADLCSFAQNSVGGGAGFNYDYPAAPYTGAGAGGSGGQAAGGALCNLGTMSVTRSSFVGNGASGGAGGRGQPGYSFVQGSVGPGGYGGRGGNGVGGAVLSSGTLYAVNCTFASNAVAGGSGGQGGAGGVIFWEGHLYEAMGGPGGNGGNGLGAVTGTNGLFHAASCTIAYNRVSHGDAGSGGSGSPLGPGGTNGTLGGVLLLAGGELLNTLLANNAPSNASGTITDAGHNLSSDASCAFGATGSVNNIDPMLGPLADNGGPTLTMALLPGSPAIDTAGTLNSPATDQRGFPRPVAAAADIGAYEYGTWLLRITRPATGVDVTFYGPIGQTCRLFAASNLSDWASIDTNQVGANGTAVFHEAVDGPPIRFYRVALP